MAQWWSVPATVVSIVLGLALLINLVMPSPELASPTTEHNPDYVRLPYGTHPGAPVTLVEFVDLQCPFCSSTHPTIARLREEFGDDLNYVLKHAPNGDIHPQALLAAVAAHCAHGQAARDDFVTNAFEHQADLSYPVLRDIAQGLSLDLKAFDECMRSDESKQAIESDLMEAARVDIRGTPTIFINGARLEGLQQEAHLYQLIEAIIDGSQTTQ
ncbi:MAG TPA: DsbA family protein [Candidatus Nanoarchaeia archaeon]|nr:DsbA family protein [Candidatus Nanoarchaeia archaeon]